MIKIGCRSDGGTQFWWSVHFQFRLQRQVDGVTEQGPQRGLLLQHDQFKHNFFQRCKLEFLIYCFTFEWFL